VGDVTNILGSARASDQFHRVEADIDDSKLAPAS
jgi:hypothetical protein